MSRTSPSAAPSASIRRRNCLNASSEGASRAKWSKRVAQPLLGHVERYIGVEYALVEREQAIHVLGEERDVMKPVDELHRSDLLHDRSRRSSTSVLSLVAFLSTPQRLRRR
jgi:hypothetical protein